MPHVERQYLIVFGHKGARYFGNVCSVRIIGLHKGDIQHLPHPCVFAKFSFLFTTEEGSEKWDNVFVMKCVAERVDKVIIGLHSSLSWERKMNLFTLLCSKHWMNCRNR